MTTDDEFLRTRLKFLSSKDSRYWEFRRQAARDGVHGLLQYPAMMVPQMQRDVLKLLLEVRPDCSRILDPFVGSGTVMTESMLAGKKFTGVDINPLAILTCRAKSYIHRHEELQKKIKRLIGVVLLEQNAQIDIDFFGRDKWFTKQATLSLCRIRKAILREPEQWAREVFWTVLAETIRQTSNSRTSTYKLHLRPDGEIATLPDPILVFNRRLEIACSQFSHHAVKRSENDERRLHRPILRCEGIVNFGERRNQKFGLVVTSPPYGDNHSTVPYGQFSYLALSWIEKDDLPGIESTTFNTRSVDTKSLGGSSILAQGSYTALENVSPSFKNFMSDLRRLARPDLEKKVASFTGDLFKSIEIIVRTMEKGAYAAWTLGNRTVGGLTVPLTDICNELHQACGARHVDTIRRRIPSKRTPVRNSVSETMSTESLLILAK